MSNKIYRLTRRLAAANRSRISIRVTKFLARAMGVVDPVNIFLCSSVIAMQSLLAVCHIVLAHIGGPKEFGDIGVPPLPHVCYRAEFGRSVVKERILTEIGLKNWTSCISPFKITRGYRSRHGSIGYL